MFYNAYKDGKPSLGLLRTSILPYFHALRVWIVWIFDMACSSGTVPAVKISPHLAKRRRSPDQGEEKLAISESGLYNIL